MTFPYFTRLTCERGMVGAEKTTGRPKRVELPQLWDDTVFRKRLATLAERKGVSVRQAMKEIGLTPAYVYRGTDARTTNLLMVVADYFKVSPSYVAGWTSDPDVEREPHQARLRNHIPIPTA